MYLYRVVNVGELKNMLGDKNDEIGTKPCSAYKSFNTFDYKKDKKYLHFFVNKKACEHIIELFKDCLNFDCNGNVENYFIITANIPIKKISEFGKGYYNPIGEISRGYDYVLKSRFEAIVDVNDFNSKFIKNVEIINVSDFKTLSSELEK